MKNPLPCFASSRNGELILDVSRYKSHCFRRIRYLNRVIPSISSDGLYIANGMAYDGDRKIYVTDCLVGVRIYERCGYRHDSEKLKKNKRFRAN